MQTILNGFSTLSQSYNSNDPNQYHDELSLMCERWLLCLKIIRQLIISGFPSDAKCVQVVISVLWICFVWFLFFFFVFVFVFFFFRIWLVKLDVLK
jgi:hypothetical protein